MNAVFSATGPAIARPRNRFATPLVWVGLVAFAVATVVLGLGTTSPLRFVLPGLLVLTVAIIVVAKQPAVAVAWIPVLMLPQEFLKVFAYEVAAFLVCGVLLLAGIFGRRSWPWKLDAVQACALALLCWAAFTGFWCDDKWWYMFHLRKLAMGFLALWTAWRLGRWIPRETLLTGITAGALGVAALTMRVAATLGAGGDIGLNRKSNTNVGWGTSNYLAALLMLMMPTVMLVALRARSKAGRIFAWTAIPLIAMVVSAAGSRGGAVVMAVLLFAMLGRQKLSRRSIVGILAVVLCLAAALIGPAGKMLVERFTSTKDQLSIVVRLFYYREAWRRLSHLPLGLGLGQGYLYPDKLSGENPHNYWLDLVPDLGVVGGLLWLGTLVLMWRRSTRVARTPGLEAEGRAMRLTILVSQINCMFEPTFSNLQYHFMFYWILGCFFGSEWQPADFAMRIRSRVPENVGPDQDAPAARRLVAPGERSPAGGGAG